MELQEKVQLIFAVTIHFGIKFFFKFLVFILTTAAFTYLLNTCNWNPFIKLPNAPW
jgi:hypothetical protein